MRRLFVLLGDPVAHSRSPAIHARAFALLSVDAVYAPCHVEPGRLAEAVSGLRALSIAGANVTVPYKEAVLPLLDRIDQRSQVLGAVNCIARIDGELVGHNTDAPGQLRALREAGIEIAGAHVVVLGAGGSARAATVAVSPTAGRVTILNRTVEKARELAGLIRETGAQADAAALGGPEARRVLARADLVINCTTVGMGTRQTPIDVAALPRHAAVLDLVYAGPPGSPAGETALLSAATARGLRAVDGVRVLVHQAVASLEVWLGTPGLESFKPAGGTRSFLAELRAAALEAPVDHVTPEPEAA